MVTVAPAPHLLHTGPGHPASVRGGRWAGPSKSENGSEPLAGAFEIFIFILSRSQSQASLRPRRPTLDGRKGAHPLTLPNVNHEVGGARPPHGRCKSDFTSRSFYFKNSTHHFSPVENVSPGLRRLTYFFVKFLCSSDGYCARAPRDVGLTSGGTSCPMRKSESWAPRSFKEMRLRATRRAC